MQKVKLVIAAIIFFHTSAHAQVSQETIAGLRAAYSQETHDSAKMYQAGQRTIGYRFSKLDDVHIVGLTLNRIGKVYIEPEDYRNSSTIVQHAIRNQPMNACALLTTRNEITYTQ